MAAFLFDLDGTLLNTLEDIARAGNAVLAAHGHATHPPAAYRRMVGDGFRHLIQRALPAPVAADLSDQALDRLVDEARAWYGAHITETTRPYAGIPEALDALARQGHALAVLSNKPHAFTTRLIAHFFPATPFQDVRGGQDGVPLKPDPAAALDMLRQMGVAPADAFYVGDSDVDVATARNAGMTSVGVAWGFRGAAELRAAQAARVIDTPAQLARIATEA